MIGRPPDTLPWPVLRWTDEGNSAWTRPVGGLVRVSAIQVGPLSGNMLWQVTNLHGDFVAGFTGSTAGLTSVYEQTEYGTFRNSAETGVRRYGWLGGSLRASDTPGGTTLMGARTYTSSMGRFASVDPVYGGNANSYDYCHGDAANCADVTGNVSCRKWFSRYTSRWWWEYAFQCRLSHWETNAAILFTGFLVTVIGAGLAGILGFVFGGPWGAALAGAVGAMVGYAGGNVLPFVYQFFCRRQKGVTIFVVLSFWGRTLVPRMAMAWPLCNW